MRQNADSAENIPEVYSGTRLLKLRVNEDLYRAFQRCVWIIINETGRDQMDIMEEVVLDFLIKHRC